MGRKVMEAPTIAVAALAHGFIRGNYLRSLYDFAALLLINFYTEYNNFNLKTFKPIKFNFKMHNLGIRKIVRKCYRIFPPTRAIVLVNSATKEVYFNNIINCPYLLINNSNSELVNGLCVKSITIPKYAYLYFKDINKPLPKTKDLVYSKVNYAGVHTTRDSSKLPNCEFAIIENETQFFRAIGHGVIPILPDSVNNINLAPPSLPYLEADYPIRINSVESLRKLLLGIRPTYNFNSIREHFPRLPSLETDLLAFCRTSKLQEGTKWKNMG